MVVLDNAKRGIFLTLPRACAIYKDEWSEIMMMMLRDAARARDFKMRRGLRADI